MIVNALIGIVHKFRLRRALQSRKWFVAVCVVLVVGGGWLFFGLMEDVITNDPLVDLDVVVNQLMQTVRTDSVDRVMVGITELGDVQVLLPIIVVALAWFIAQRAWLTAGYWLTGILVAELLAKVLKLTLRRQRPGGMYDGIEQFSFPSGHATMSVVTYAFLAVLLCSQMRGGLRKIVIAVAATLVTLIALSRVYLGVHWLSDVLGGLSFGVAWVAALALAYKYQSREELRPERFAAIIAVTIIASGIIHIASSAGTDLIRYTQPIAGSG